MAKKSVEKTYNRADRQEPDHDPHDFLQSFGIFAYYSTSGDCVKKIKADIEIENRTDSDRAEETNKQSLLHLFNLTDFPVHSKDNREASKEQDKHAKEYQTIDRDNAVMSKERPGAYSTEPYEYRQVSRKTQISLV